MFLSRRLDFPPDEVRLQMLWNVVDNQDSCMAFGINLSLLEFIEHL